MLPSVREHDVILHAGGIGEYTCILVICLRKPVDYALEAFICDAHNLFHFAQKAPAAGVGLNETVNSVI